MEACQAEQSHLSQPFLTREMLQSLKCLHGPSLDPPVCPCLSGTGEPRAGGSSPGAASPVPNRGEQLSFLADSCVATGDHGETPHPAPNDSRQLGLYQTSPSRRRRKGAGPHLTLGATGEVFPLVPPGRSPHQRKQTCLPLPQKKKKSSRSRKKGLTTQAR